MHVTIVMFLSLTLCPCFDLFCSILKHLLIDISDIMVFLVVHFIWHLNNVNLEMHKYINYEGGVIAPLIFYNNQITLSSDGKVTSYPLMLFLSKIACEDIYLDVWATSRWAFFLFFLHHMHFIKEGLNCSTNVWKSSFNPWRTQVSGFDPKPTFEYFIVSLGLQNYIIAFQFILIMINRCVFYCPFFSGLALTIPMVKKVGVPIAMCLHMWSSRRVQSHSHLWHQQMPNAKCQMPCNLCLCPRNSLKDVN